MIASFTCTIVSCPKKKSPCQTVAQQTMWILKKYGFRLWTCGSSSPYNLGIFEVHMYPNVVHSWPVLPADIQCSNLHSLFGYGGEAVTAMHWYKKDWVIYCIRYRYIGTNDVQANMSMSYIWGTINSFYEEMRGQSRVMSKTKDKHVPISFWKQN
jgi:hypothetical protein